MLSVFPERLSPIRQGRSKGMTIVASVAPVSTPPTIFLVLAFVLVSSLVVSSPKHSQFYEILPSLRVHAFSPSLKTATCKGFNQRQCQICMIPRPLRSTASDKDAATLPDPSDMKLREIQSELKERNVSYADCFDRDSLTKRLIESRETHPIATSDETSVSSQSEESTSNAAQSTQTTAPSPDPATKSSSESTSVEKKADGEELFDRQSTLETLRSMRIKELRTELSKNNVRWGTMIEKEELVQALCQVMQERFEASKNFSRSGELMPGIVTDVDDNVLKKELGWVGAGAETDISVEKPHAPILLDVYATWCGPCQFVVPQLKAAAEEFGPKVRVVKLDSDKYPQLSSTLKVGGLPTMILFDGGNVSKEIDRVEGALTKDGIVQFVESHLSK